MPPVPIVLPPILEKQLHTVVEAKVRKRLGLKDGDQTPPELTKLISDEVSRTGEPVLKANIAADVQSTLAGIGKASSLDRFKQNLGLAQAGMGAIAQAQEVDDILKKRAELLFKKRSALETAGFTSKEAMDIVLADISTKAH